MMKQKGYDVTQYILEGTICIENNKQQLLLQQQKSILLQRKL